jgi:hypothetical protein
MTQKFSVLTKYSFYIVFISIFYSSISYAEIFKWVDSNGRTHYSDTKLSVGKSNVETLKISSPNITIGHTAEPIYSLKKENLVHTPSKTKKQIKQNKIAPLFKIAKSGWGGKGPETDKKRCALARDILSGAARHTNGLATDTHDIKVAQRDVGKFCH